ncbi:MAG: hypothetical protein ACYC91_08760 [Solirubrobacteraceae bacterium]
MLIDKALNPGLRPVALSPLAAPHLGRDGLVFRWPSDKGKQDRLSSGGGRGHHRLPYEQDANLLDRDLDAALQSVRAMLDPVLTA